MLQVMTDDPEVVEPTRIEPDPPAEQPDENTGTSHEPQTDAPPVPQTLPVDDDF
jgi:hypothetical protein